VKRLDVRDKHEQELQRLLRSRRRKDLISLIRDLASIEQHFTAEEIAKARKTTKRDVIERMKKGEIAAHHPSGYRWTASLSAVREWDERTAIRLFR
jgi:hypothetical protein